MPTVSPAEILRAQFAVLKRPELARFIAKLAEAWDSNVPLVLVPYADGSLDFVLPKWTDGKVLIFTDRRGEMHAVTIRNVWVSPGGNLRFVIVHPDLAISLDPENIKAIALADEKMHVFLHKHILEGLEKIEEDIERGRLDELIPVAQGESLEEAKAHIVSDLRELRSHLSRNPGDTEALASALKLINQFYPVKDDLKYNRALDLARAWKAFLETARPSLVFQQLKGFQMGELSFLVGLHDYTKEKKLLGLGKLLLLLLLLFVLLIIGMGIVSSILGGKPPVPGGTPGVIKP